MKKKDGKEKYRKKSYTRPKKPVPISDANKEALVWLKERIYELKHIEEPTENDKRNLRLYRKLWEIGLKGFNSAYFISFMDENRYRLTKDFEDARNKYPELIKEKNNREKDCERIFKILDKWYRPFTRFEDGTFINNPELEALKWEIKKYLVPINLGLESMKDYFEGEKGLSLTSKHPSFYPLWYEHIKMIVKDLTKVGYSNRSAHKITMQLLKDAYPEIFGDIKLESIRDRYGYQKNPRKIKEKTKQQAPTYRFILEQPEFKPFDVSKLRSSKKV